MSRFIITLLLFFSLTLANAQYIIDKKRGKIDIRELPDKYITIYGPTNKLAFDHRLECSLGGKIRLQGTRLFQNDGAYNVYDGETPVNMGSISQVLSFFEKYGYQYFEDRTTTKNVINFYYGTSSSKTVDKILLRKVENE